MDLKVIDNFLSENEFNLLVSNTIGRNDGQQVQFRVVSNVENYEFSPPAGFLPFSAAEENWSWYMINMVYLMDAPQNEICGKIYQMFVPKFKELANFRTCLLYTSPSPRDRYGSRMPSSA